MRAVLKQFGLGAATVAALLFVGCNSSSTPAASDTATAAKPAAEAPAAMVTGKTAYYTLYKSAFSWSSDALVTKIAAKDVTGFKMDAGKAGVWEVTFASPGKHMMRTDTYSITTVLPDIHKGGAAGMQMPWGGQTRDAMPVEISSSTVDSDAAYQAATVDAAEFLKKNPGKPLTDFELGATAKLPNPFWYIVWGDSKSGGYVVVVDAVTGKVVKK